jgi:hypothetical protein
MDKDAFELVACWLLPSSRERQVTYFTCIEYKNTQISCQNCVTTRTVKSCEPHVFFKIGVRSKTDFHLKFYNFERNPPISRQQAALVNCKGGFIEAGLYD